jgi:signal transduction histidine kinase
MTDFSGNRRSPVPVGSGVPARAPGGRVDDLNSQARRAAECALGHDCSLADGVATEVSAKTAMALTLLLADVRGILVRLTQIGEGPVEDERRAIIATALNKLNRGDRLASELLAYAGRQPLAPEAVELLPLLCSLADLLRHSLDRRIDVTVQVDDDCPPCHVDRRALEAALINLAVNARDAMPHGGRMHFRTCVAAPANDVCAVEVSVLDSGVGMEATTSACAALPYFTTKTNDPLAGLGLAAVDGFVRQSGGSMVVRTWMGSGTVVTLRLPCVGEDARRRVRSMQSSLRACADEQTAPSR